MEIIFSSVFSAESYRLLNLSDDDDSLDDSHNEATIPDLQLYQLHHQGQRNGLQQRIKRKIRLKRKDRDRLTGLNLTSAETTSDEAIDDSECWPSSSSCCGSSAAKSGLTCIAIAAVVTVLMVTAFLTVKLHLRVADMSMQLERGRNDPIPRLYWFDRHGQKTFIRLLDSEGNRVIQKSKLSTNVYIFRESVGTVAGSGKLRSCCLKHSDVMLTRLCKICS